MNKIIKYIFILLGGAFLFVSGWIIRGLYFMEVEDYYGDLQTIYWQAKSKDIIVCPQSRQVGQLEKKGCRIYVSMEDGREQELNSWVYKTETLDSLVVYRQETKTPVSLGYNAIMNAIDKQSLKKSWFTKK